MRRRVVVVFAAMAALTLVLIFFQDRFDVNSHPLRRTHVRQILQSKSTPSGIVETLEPNSDIYELVLPQYTYKPQLENLPNIYLESEKPSKALNKTCALFPKLVNVKFHNDHWQTQNTSNGTFQLLNAYLDDRDGFIVRIVGLLDRVRPMLKTYCQMWFNSTSKPLIIETEPYFYLWNKDWGGQTGNLYQPYLISCRLPDDLEEVPISVSLSEGMCQNTTNNLQLVYERYEEQEDFVVCVKGLNFPDDDKTVRLAEWIELLNILGADKISFYEFSVHPNVKKLLDYYIDQGKIEVTPLTLVGSVSNTPYLQDFFLRKQVVPRRLQEVIPYNDCLYRHLYRYKYVVLLDVDEVIMPLSDTWLELLEVLQEKHKNVDSFSARNVYFLDSHQHDHEWFADVPSYMHMLQHVFRARNYTKPGHYIKCFHDTGKVVALHNHFPKLCLKDKHCRTTEIELSLAHLQHYRSDCVRGVGNCNDLKADSVMDTTIWKFKNALISRVQKTLLDLGMLKLKD